MKKIILTALLGIGLFSACKKENEDQPPAPTASGRISKIIVVEGTDTTVNNLTYNSDSSLQSFSTVDGYMRQ